MKALFHLADEIQDFFKKNVWKFCFIGGISLQRWGEPRLTQDVDICLLTGYGDEESYVDALLRKYQGRIKDTKEFALKNRALLLVSSRGIGIGIALACLPYEGEVIKRSSSFEFLPGIQLQTCSAEDLIIMKSFADRNRDWADVEGILLRQENHVDWPYIERHLTPLCKVKQSPEIIDKLNDLRNKLKT
jgi:hypothetical protein